MLTAVDEANGIDDVERVLAVEADELHHLDLGPAPTRASSPGGVAMTGRKTAAGNRGNRSAGADHQASPSSPATPTLSGRRRPSTRTWRRKAPGGPRQPAGAVLCVPSPAG